MTKFAHITRILQTVFLLVFLLSSLSSNRAFAAGVGQACQTSGSNDKTGNCVDSNASDNKTAFCNTGSSANNQGTCVECALSEMACFRMYDNAATNTYLYYSKLYQLPTMTEGMSKSLGLGSSSEAVSAEKTGQFQISYAAVGIANLIMPSDDALNLLAAQGISVPPGAVQYIASGISSMTTQQPVNTGVYLADLGRQIGVSSPAYAADGTGFAALQPVLKLWKAFRNMAYLLVVVIFIILGFMIMFRSKISQQTVISVQLALPQIIITLLLITFSYAIASLMIDLIYFLIYLITGIFSAFGVLSDDGKLARNMLLGKNLIGIAFNSSMAKNAADGFGTVFADLVGNTIGQGLGWVTSIFAYLIFAIAILISLFKLFFQLLTSYVGLIVSTIFSPILILFNALPGSQSFSKWLKGVFANALIFPVTALMLLVAAALAGDSAYGIDPSIGYENNPNMYNSIALPLLVGNGADNRGINTNAFQALIGIGILMMMPKVVELVQKALGVEGGLGGMMAGIMEPIQAGANAAAWAPKRAWNINQQTARERAAENAERFYHGKDPIEKDPSPAARQRYGFGSKVRRFVGLQPSNK